jgi:hypothetical protein
LSYVKDKVYPSKVTTAKEVRARDEDENLLGYCAA